jgi:transcriptional regulator with XRE-family HTH domain
MSDKEKDSSRVTTTTSATKSKVTIKDDLAASVKLTAMGAIGKALELLGRMGMSPREMEELEEKIVVRSIVELKNLTQSITQSRIADIVGVTNPMITKYINGERSPSLGIALSILAASGVSMPELIQGVGNDRLAKLIKLIDRDPEMFDIILCLADVDHPEISSKLRSDLRFSISMIQESSHPQ